MPLVLVFLIWQLVVVFSKLSYKVMFCFMIVLFVDRAKNYVGK